MLPVLFVEKTNFGKQADVEKVCKKPHFRPEAVYRYCEREKRRLICNTKYFIVLDYYCYLTVK